jgi:lysozyme
MKTNQAGLDLIKKFEGLRLKAYQDSVNVWTIGYGHTGPDVYRGQVISASEAEQLLKDDLIEAEHDVMRLVHVPLTENQFAALVSFTFNLGGGALKKSTLLRVLNLREYDHAGKQFLVWNRAGGKVLKGLTVRRQAERELFLKA